MLLKGALNHDIHTNLLQPNGSNILYFHIDKTMGATKNICFTFTKDKSCLFDNTNVYCHHFIIIQQMRLYETTSTVFRLAQTANKLELHPSSNVIGICFAMPNDGISFQCIGLKFPCNMVRSFAFIVENITNVCYSVTPVWTFKCSKVWKTRCQNPAAQIWIWR